MSCVSLSGCNRALLSFSENYFCLGSKGKAVVPLKSGHFKLQEIRKPEISAFSFVKTAAKVITYFTIILPIIIYCVRAVLRYAYESKVPKKSFYHVLSYPTESDAKKVYGEFKDRWTQSGWLKHFPFILDKHVIKTSLSFEELESLRPEKLQIDQEGGPDPKHKKVQNGKAPRIQDISSKVRKMVASSPPNIGQLELEDNQDVGGVLLVLVNRYQGLIIGDMNNDDEYPISVLLNMMKGLKKSGVGTLFVSDLYYSSQPALDAWLKSKNETMPPQIEDLVSLIDSDCHSGYKKLLQCAKEVGIRVVGLAHEEFDNLDTSSNGEKYIMTKIIDHESTGKWIALVDQSIVEEQLSPSLSQLTGKPQVDPHEFLASESFSRNSTW